MERVSININPQVLRWAREESGYTQSEIASKADVPTEKYIGWEKEGKNVPLGKLKVIATAYKRQLAAFLLPIIPDKILKPTDFRNLNSTDRKLSKKVLGMIRDVSYFRETAFEIHGSEYWRKRYEWFENINVKNFENLHSHLRELLDISIADQLSWKSDSEAYRKWRFAVENRLGILVFQFPLQMTEIQGCCFTDKLPYAIVTNSNHTYTGRIFTIFHELAHILHHESGMCLFENASSRNKIEWECNNFAGEFLLPEQLISEALDFTDVVKYASRLKVSREVYLRRLREVDMISNRDFSNYLDQIKATYKIPKKRSGFVKPEVKSKAVRGETFYNMILDAMYRNQISYSKASNVLNLNLSTLFNEI